MEPAQLQLLLVQLAAMLLVGLLFGEWARRHNLPVVFGELLGGVLLGPTILGAIAPGIHSWLFGDGPVQAARNAAVTIGLLLFAFIAGLQVSLQEIRRNVKAVLPTSVLGMVLPFLCGVAFVALWPQLWSTEARIGKLRFALFLGTALMTALVTSLMSGPAMRKVLG